MPAEPQHLDTCEYLRPGSAGVALFRSNAASFAVEGEGAPLIRIGVLLRGMVRTETPSGLLVSDARASPRVFMLPADLPYAITAIPGHGPAIIGASIEQDAFAGYIEGQSGAPKPRNSAPTAPMALDDAVAALGLEAFHRSLWLGASSLEWEAWLLTSLRRLFGDGGLARRPAASAEPRGVDRAREYIHAHYRDAISLEELADVAGVSKYHLVRTFRAAVGAPPHRYQQCLRLTRSLLMLRRGTPLSAIAYELGFADQSHFTRAFRAEYGTTPGAWLRALGKPSAPDPAPPRAPAEGTRGSGPFIGAGG
jgi:AraC-like DNA-binding protein